MRFAVQGAGSQYVHGSASLQEICVSVITYHHQRAVKDDEEPAHKVGVQINARARRVTNNRFNLNLVQAETVKVKGEFKIMTNDKTKKEDIDIFIANDVYPDPLQIFNSKFKTREEIKNDCFIVLDTNALLLPYTTSKATLEGIKNTYTKLISEKRLIVPGQVAREFAKNRAKKLSELYQNISKRRDNIQLPTQDDFYPLLENLDIYKQAKELESELHKIRRQYNKTTEILEHIKQWHWNDPVSSLYANLFSQEVILDLEIEEGKKEKIKADLKRRDLHKIPPGYKDSSKADEGIGDLLIWQTILKIGEIHKKSVIFVSGEEKPDWWHRSNDQKLYPRYELVEEFRRGSEGQSFYMIDLAELLKLYGANKDVVEEVKQEEKRASNLNFEQVRGQVKEISYKQLLSAVYQWLNNQNEYQKIYIENQGFLDIFAISNKGYKIGVKIKLVKSSRFSYHLKVNQYIEAFSMLYKEDIQKMMLFFVAENEENILNLALNLIDNNLDVPSNFSIIGGFLDSNGKFEPTVKFGN